MAASVIQHQLDRLGMTIAVEAVSREVLVSRFDRGGYQLCSDRSRRGSAVSAASFTPQPERPSMTGFADPAYDAAVAARDFAKAQALLDREMPVYVLYEWRAFAAIDARFCGDVTPSPTLVALDGRSAPVR